MELSAMDWSFVHKFKKNFLNILVLFWTYLTFELNFDLKTT